MIWQVIAIQLRRLRHNRVEWVLTFVVPLVFFSIFALIFGRGIGGTPRVKVALVQEVAAKKTPAGASPGPPISDAIVARLADSPGLKIVSGDPAGETGSTGQISTRPAAERLVRRGGATIAIVVRESADGQLSFELLNDASDQVASQVVSALVTRAVMMPPGGGLEASGPGFEGGDRPEAYPTGPGFEGGDRPEAYPTGSTLGGGDRPEAYPTGPPEVVVTSLLGQGKNNPVISVYAAGIAVMFLLFGASSGGGVLLEERENQTLERLLCTRMSLDHLLLGKWFYLTLLGCVQVTVMFLWAQAVFGLDLLGHVDGFVMMTVATSAAAASFGLVLATLCRTRGQLNGLSVVAVLTMSALGGSMVPRYVMSPALREAGLWTFNAWALDGYDKVFWRELPVAELAPQLAVLLGAAVGLLAIARLLAIGWETA